MSKKDQQSQEDIFLELKLIAFRKKLEEDNQKNQKVNQLIVLYEEEKQKSFERIKQNSYECMKQSLPFAIPVGLGNIFLFKSLLVFPITLAIGYFACGIYNSKKQQPSQQ